LSGALRVGTAIGDGWEPSWSSCGRVNSRDITLHPLAPPRQVFDPHRRSGRPSRIARRSGRQTSFDIAAWARRAGSNVDLIFPAVSP
jgi:hypothetical protein